MKVTHSKINSKKTKMALPFFIASMILLGSMYSITVQLTSFQPLLNTKTWSDLTIPKPRMGPKDLRFVLF